MSDSPCLTNEGLCLLGSEISKPICGCHSTVHEEVAAGDERALGSPEQCAYCPDLVRYSGSSGCLDFQHSPVSRTPWSFQFVVSEWSDDDAGADGIDSCGALSPADRLSHTLPSEAALSASARTDSRDETSTLSVETL
jgi:hypothetical protein